MKKFSSNPLLVISVFCFALIAFGLSGPITAQAATSPSLGTAATYGIISSTYTNSLNAGLETAITGDVCYTTAPVLPPISWTIPNGTPPGTPIVPCPPATGTAQTAALADLNTQANAPACTNLGAGPIALDTVIIPGNAPGIFPPGCYTTAGAMTITLGTTVTLSLAAPGGVGNTWIFRPGGAITTGANSKVVLAGGASACDVFWAPVGATTLGANAATSATPTFVGNIFRGTAPGLSITLGKFVNLEGRLLAFGSTVTTDSNTITVPVCAALPPSGGSTTYTGTVNVVKTVVGGTKTVADFPLFINGNLVTSGVTNTFTINNTTLFEISETADPNYTQTFSGDCDSNGDLYLMTGGNMFCVITNTYKIIPVVVPPIIEVVKVPSPLSLPTGPGLVNYTYTLRNIGTVPVTNITMVGDTCSPITLTSGDTNTDAKLQVNETWIYNCSTTLTETHTNNVVATGWANGISATDIASATVIVGLPVVPPLIHVTKVPSPLALAAKGGMVTYTEKITNPGTVALSNVRLTDDKCSPMAYVSGDTNGDTKLDTTETWTYTCRTNLTKTTTNIATATGEANGYTVRDLATATVVVAATVPVLPNTGFAPEQIVLVLAAIAVGIFAVLTFFYLARKKQTN